MGLLLAFLVIWCIGWCLLHPLTTGKALGIGLGYFIVGGMFIMIIGYVGYYLINS